MINAEWYNKSHYIYKLSLKFLQIPNNIVKIKDSENRLQINGNLNFRFSIIKKNCLQQTLDWPLKNQMIKVNFYINCFLSLYQLNFPILKSKDSAFL